jgi:hypothetical protein
MPYIEMSCGAILSSWQERNLKHHLETCKHSNGCRIEDETDDPDTKKYGKNYKKVDGWWVVKNPSNILKDLGDWP